MPYSFKSVVFDLDGVITKTAAIHSKAWKATFDEFLSKREGSNFKPFTDQDYLSFVDGRPRYEGVRCFLASRNYHLAEGSPGQKPEGGEDTICSVGDRKNELFKEFVHRIKPEVYDSTVRLINELRSNGIGVGVASSSENCLPILQNAGLDHLFDARVDGVVSIELKLKGKPNPDIFVVCAEKMKTKPDQSIVFEDALSGVEAGKRGNFGLVVGLARQDNSKELLDHGADVALTDWSDHTLDDLEGWFRSRGQQRSSQIPTAPGCGM